MASTHQYNSVGLAKQWVWTSGRRGGGCGVEFVTASRRGPGGGSRGRAVRRGSPRVVGGLAEFRSEPPDVLAGDATPGGTDGARRRLGRPGIRNARPRDGGAGSAGAATLMDRNRLLWAPVDRGAGRACIPLP